MKFYLKKIGIWLNNGSFRELVFFNNKVNIITGEQSTGKSTIIEIIDFCFFASSSPIVQGDEYIDQIAWFGINFIINDKHLTIVRHSKSINDYYFSSSGEIPEAPFPNFPEDKIRNIINLEFQITDNVVFPYGGNKITKGTKISPRYFLLFNTQRRNVLSSDEVLFDKQSGEKYIRYQEALARIFDIALGVTTIDNLIKHEMVVEKEKELAKLIRQEEHLSKKFNTFEEEIDKLCQKAKSLNIVSLKMSNEECIVELKQQLQDISKIPILDNQLELENYEQEKLRLQIKLSKYEKYITQYKKYKNLLKNDTDSLKPILYLQENFTDVINISKTDTIINSIAIEYQAIKNFIAQKESPAIIDLTGKIKEIKDKLQRIDANIQNISVDEKVVDTNRKQQLIFLGEVKSSLEFYSHDHVSIDYTKSIEKIENDIKV